jgi:hypothetical protein
MRYKSRKFIIIFLALALIALEFFWIAKKFNFFEPKSQDSAEAQKPSSASPGEPNVLPSAPSAAPAPNPAPEPPASEPVKPAPKSILLSVPFFSQAPFGEWSDLIFQNACEEASIIMAMHWVNKTSVTLEQAKQEILTLTEFEDRTYGPAIDRATADAIKMFKDYYNYENVSLRSNIGAEDIKAEILKGNLVIVPLDGRILANPYYTAPGPDHHMLVVIGYDGNKNEFITNDVGTRHGEKYRYSEVRFQASLQDYPTGNDLPSVPGQTAMIVVMPK